MKHLSFIISLFILLPLFSFSQEFSRHCGMPDAPPIPTEGFGGGCVAQTDWDNFNGLAYQPFNQDIQDLTVKVNFIFWETEDPIIEWDGTVSHGNFDLDNPVHLTFLNAVVNDMNARIGDINFPNDLGCLNAEEDFLQMGKIQFDVEMYNITDTYLWDITNATETPACGTGGPIEWYCPNNWCDEYTDQAYDKLNQAGVRNAINVFWGQEGPVFHQIIVDNIPPPGATDFTSIASSTDCSEFPGDQDNLNQRLRVAMTNEYFAYRFGDLVDDQYPNGPLISGDAAHYGISRVTLHELGHSLSLGHIFDCPENVMDDGGAQNVFRPDQLGRMHRALHLTSVRNHVVCEQRDKYTRVITDTERWTFNTKIYSSIIIDRDAELTICGEVFMPRGGSIIVRNGGRLILDGGTISIDREEYENCPDETWLGIFVHGNPDRFHSEVDINNQQSDDPGILLMRNGSLIERSRFGVQLSSNLRIGWSEEEDATHNYEDIESSDVYTFTDYYYPGGIIQAENSTFRNNGQAAYLPHYDHANASFFDNCTFELIDTPESPFDNDNTTRGVTVLQSRGVTFTDCTFRDINGPGIAIANGQANILSRNEFETCTYGIYAVGTDPFGENTIIGLAENELDDRNSFLRNGNGIYLGGVSGININNNLFEENTFCVNVSGETGFDIQNNEYARSTYAENYENSGPPTLDNRTSCNFYTDIGYGQRLLGDNRSVSIDGNDYSNVNEIDDLPNIDIFLRHAFNTDGQSITGRLRNQGISNLDGRENVINQGPSSDIRTNNQTQSFTYYYLNATDDIFQPQCAANDPCLDEVYNFLAFGIDGENDLFRPCEEVGGAGGDDCYTKDCLDERYEELEVRKELWDSGLSAELATKLQSGEIDAEAYALLEAGSPLIQESYLRTVLYSSLSKQAKADILDKNRGFSTELMGDADAVLPPYMAEQLRYKNNMEPFHERIFQSSAEQSLLGRKNRALMNVVQSMYKQGESHEAHTLLQNDGSDIAQRAAIALHIKDHDFSAATTVLSNYPATSPDQQDYHLIIAAQIQMANQEELDETTLATLTNIANGEGLHSGHAQSILLQTEGLLFMPDEEETTQGLQSSDYSNGVAQMAQRQNKMKASLQVSPNPATDQITLQYAGLEAPVKLEIIDLQGRILHTANFSGHAVLDVSDFPSGLILIKTYLPEGVVLSKVVVK